MIQETSDLRCVRHVSLRSGLRQQDVYVIPNFNKDYYLISKPNYAIGLSEIHGYLMESDRPLRLLVSVLLNFMSSYQLKRTPISETNEEISKMRFSEYDNTYYKKLINVSLIYNKLGPKYNIILSSYRALLPRKLQPGLDMIVNYIPSSFSEADYLTWTKDFGTYCLEKIINENYPLYLLYFVELHIMSGYDTYYHRNSDMRKDCIPFTIDRHLDPCYDVLMRKNIVNTVNKLVINSYPNCTFEDYVKYRDNWNIIGSATIGRPMDIKSTGFKKATRIGSKFTNCLYYDDRSLLDTLYKYEGHRIEPFLKTDEAAKARVVIGYDTRSYIRCSYLETFIRSFNSEGEKWTTVGDSPENLFDIRKIVNNNIKANYQDKYRMICTDQSAFDQHQYKHLFIYAFNMIAQRIMRFNPQVRKIVELENYGMEHAKIYLSDGSTLPWKNGLLSGHKFTALIGSILNRAATLTALQLSGVQAPFGVFQGDDALIMIPKEANYKEFLDQYRKLDLVVNPMKTWHGMDRTEYLHQVYIRDRVIALPTRACLGLLFKKPKSIELGPDDKFRNDIDQFRMAARRGLMIEHFLNVRVRNFFLKYESKYVEALDAIRSTQNTKKRRYLMIIQESKLKKDVYNYIHTPTLYEGAGFEPYVERKYYRMLYVSKKADDGVVSHIKSNYHYRIPYEPILTEKWILRKVYDRLPQPKVSTKVELRHVDLREKTKLIDGKIDKESFSFNPSIEDNSINWLNHVKTLLNEACEYGRVYTLKFNHVRSKLSETFNLISNVTNGFLGKSSKHYFHHCYDKCIQSYLRGKHSITSLQHYLNLIKRDLFKSYRENPPDWYSYCFSF